MRVLVACEFSGRVRDAFARRGHDAWSCDIRPSEAPGNHIQDSILEQSVVKRGWDAMIAFPDCTFLTVSGARWNHEEWREEAQLAALHFVKALWKFPVPKLAIENPVGRLSSLWRGPTQIIQPWMFGDNETKGTCLWLRGFNGRLLSARRAPLSPSPEPDMPATDTEQKLAAARVMLAALEGRDPEDPSCIQPLSWLRSLIDDARERGPAANCDDPDAYFTMLQEVEDFHGRCTAAIAAARAALSKAGG